jgi:multisubunit Na+/H+ antiporter MnhB subunit
VRYVVQFLVPALVVIVVMIVLLRNRGNPSSTASAAAPADAGGLSTGTFVVILVIGAIFTVALIYALYGSGSPS